MFVEHPSHAAARVLRAVCRERDEAAAPAGPASKRPRGRPPMRGKLAGRGAYARSLPHMKAELVGAKPCRLLVSDMILRIPRECVAATTVIYIAAALGKMQLRLQSKSACWTTARQPYF